MSSEKTVQTFALVGDWVTIPDIAEALDLKVTRVHNLISDGTLVALREPDTNVRKVPALFLNGDHVLDSLKGTLVVLNTADDSLPGRPIDALINGQKTEIRRRAQALAW